MIPDDKSESTIGTSLLVRVRNLDPDAWRRLVHIYGPLVFKWCVKAGLKSEDAADVGQEVFRAVADGISKFRRDREGDTFVGWLRTITRFKVADYRRRQSTDPQAIGGTDFQIAISQLSEDMNEVAEEEHADGTIDSIVYRRALEIIKTEFEQRTWQAFWAAAIDGRPTADIADELGMTTMAVRKAKSRVLRRLRDEFDESCLD